MTNPRTKRKLNRDQIAQVESLAAYLSIEQIANYFGMSKPTFYAIMERQPNVLLRYKKGKANAIGSIAKSLLKKAREGCTTSQIFYLKTQAGWSEKQQIEVIEENNEDLNAKYAHLLEVKNGMLEQIGDKQ